MFSEYVFVVTSTSELADVSNFTSIDVLSDTMFVKSKFPDGSTLIGFIEKLYV